MFPSSHTSNALLVRSLVIQSRASAMLRRLCAPRAAGLLRAALPPLAPRVALPARSLSTAVQRVQPSTRPPPPPIELNRSAALLLQMPTEIGPFALNNIRDNIGARRKTRRLGRGVGSGRGRKLGRGQKGLKSRAGNHGLLKSDGGQTKLTKRVRHARACTPTTDYSAAASVRPPPPPRRCRSAASTSLRRSTARCISTTSRSTSARVG